MRHHARQLRFFLRAQANPLFTQKNPPGKANAFTTSESITLIVKAPMRPNCAPGFAPRDSRISTTTGSSIGPQIVPLPVNPCPMRFRVQRINLRARRLRDYRSPQRVLFRILQRPSLSAAPADWLRFFSEPTETSFAAWALAAEVAAAWVAATAWAIATGLGLSSCCG